MNDNKDFTHNIYKENNKQENNDIQIKSLGLDFDMLHLTSTSPQSPHLYSFNIRLVLKTFSYYFPCFSDILRQTMVFVRIMYFSLNMSTSSFLPKKTFPFVSKPKY